MSDSDKSDTVELYGMKDGIQVHLGQAPMPPRMKAKEIVVSVFGHFDEHDDMDDGDAALCFSCMTELIDYMTKQERTQAAKITELESQVEALRVDAERLKEIETSHEYKAGLAVNRAAGKLPEGFYIEIFLENGCGEVQLFNHERKKVVFEQDDMYFYEQIGAAIDAAIKGEQAA
jgi:hypothetical protein